MPPDPVTALARKWAEKFFTEHPSPDAAWFIREALIPMLADYIVRAVREALECSQKRVIWWQRELREKRVAPTLATMQSMLDDWADAALRGGTG